MSRGPVAVPPGGFRDIAVIRLSSLGDVVLTLPVVHALRAAYPGARLSYWVKEEFADVVRHDPAVSHVRALEREARRVEDVVSMSAELEDSDLIVDLHGNPRSRLLSFRQKCTVLRAPSFRTRRWRWVAARWSRPAPAPTALARYAAALAPIGLAPAGPPRLSAGEPAEAWARGWVAAWGPGPAPIALAPGARHFTKRWPEAQWLALHERLAAAGHRLLYLSLAAERAALPALAARVAADPAARWCTEPLARMAALLSNCGAAVTHDSGLMHVAAARGVRVVALFGSTVPELGFPPSGEGHVVLCRHEPCQPCTVHGRPACPRGHFRCMTGIGPDLVLESLQRIVRPVPVPGPAGPGPG